MGFGSVLYSLKLTVVQIGSNSRKYLFDTVYMNEKIKGTFDKAKKVVKEIYSYLSENEQEFLDLYQKEPLEGETLERQICDFIAGMTDSYALNLYYKLFLPDKWEVG